MLILFPDEDPPGYHTFVSVTAPPLCDRMANHEHADETKPGRAGNGDALWGG